jgi:CDP-paratose 2-epimerase
MKKADRFRSVAILGGAGFVGSNLAHHLLRSTDAKINIFDNLSRPGVRYNLDSLQRAAGNSGRLQITIGDVRDAAMVERVLRHATEVYHFAAQVAVTTAVDDPRLDFEVNLQGTFNVLEAVRKHGRRPFLLYTSTNKVYGEMASHKVVMRDTRWEYEHGIGISEEEPLDLHSPYGCSKGAADQYVRDYSRIYGIPTVVFRMSCIAGQRQFGNEDQGWVAHFLYSALSNTPVLLYGDGRQVRDVLSVDDLVDAICLARENAEVTAGQIYNVGGGSRNTTSLLELMDTIEDLTGRCVRYTSAASRPADQRVYVTDTAKFRRDTGWQPRLSVRQTMERIYDFWKRNRDLFGPAASADRGSIGALEQLPGAA